MKVIISICSARPNFVKLAAVHHAVKNRSDVKHVIVHTGQHYDPLFSDVFFEQLDIPTPEYNLGIHGGDRESTIAETHKALAEILPEIKPDAVLVYGDVNGAVGAARAAKEFGCTLVHVEAGLRSFDQTMPEEINRIEIDHAADLLLCSEQSGVDHLAEEKVSGRIELVGNTMIDTLIRMMPVIEKAEVPFAVPNRYAIVTVHRPSNTDDPAELLAVVDVLEELSSRIALVLPVHHRLKAALERDGLLDRVKGFAQVVDPLGYVPFIKLLIGSSFILTDSGGVQEEATYVQKPCFTLRLNTERPSTIDSGSNRLINLKNVQDREAVLHAADAATASEITVPKLWDGKAGERIVNVLLSLLES